VSKSKGLIRLHSDTPFFLILGIIGSVYIILIVAMIMADLSFTSVSHIVSALKSEEIQYSIKLSLFTCTITMFLSVLVAIPLGYLLANYNFPGKKMIDSLIDVPIILPPLVVGLSLLILFQTAPGQWIERHVQVTYAIPSIILGIAYVTCT